MDIKQTIVNLTNEYEEMSGLFKNLKYFRAVMYSQNNSQFLYIDPFNQLLEVDRELEVMRVALKNLYQISVYYERSMLPKSRVLLIDALRDDKFLKKYTKTMMDFEDNKKDFNSSLSEIYKGTQFDNDIDWKNADR